MSAYNTLHYLIAILEKFKIKHIVASPGFQNSNFNRFLQSNDNFCCHSVVDERSAGYVALGIARETDSPVVLSCTGATASRNYLSALTEAYYSKVPIIAVTFFPYSNTKYNLAPQYIDRSVSQTDIKAVSIELPLIKNSDDITKCILLLNSALIVAKYKKMPIHINCPCVINFDMTYDLPQDVWATKYIKNDLENLRQELHNKKLGIFIGEHSAFSELEEKAISNFAKIWNAPVYCDHTSQYHGENKILISQIANMKRFHSHADIIIDIGRICGDYSYPSIFKKAEISINSSNVYLPLAFKQNKTYTTSIPNNKFENRTAKGINALATYNTYVVKNSNNFNIPTLNMIPVPDDLSTINGEKVFSEDGNLESVVVENEKYKIRYKNNDWKTIEIIDKNTNKIVQTQNCMVANSKEVRVSKELDNTGVGYFTDYDEINGEMVQVGRGKHVYYPNDTKKEFIRWINPQTQKESYQVIERSNVSSDPLSCDKSIEYDENWNIKNIQQFKK